MATTNTYQAVIATPLGRIGLRMIGEAVGALDYLPAAAPEQPATDAATEAVVSQLQAYFCDPGYRFSMPLAITGTAVSAAGVGGVAGDSARNRADVWRTGAAVGNRRSRHWRRLSHQSACRS
jgi:hypothetical protein